jgi:hypothetical protein
MIHRRVAYASHMKIFLKKKMEKGKEQTVTRHMEGRRKRSPFSPKDKRVELLKAWSSC